MHKPKVTHPFLPVASLADVLAYRSYDASTHTPSPLINAVIQVLHDTQFLEAGEVADFMALDRRKLTCALQIELGMSLQELIVEFRLHHIQEYIKSHPKATLEEVASSNGYSSDSSIWRLFFRRLGTTPSGEKSSGSKEEWIHKMKRLNAHK